MHGAHTDSETDVTAVNEPAPKPFWNQALVWSTLGLFAWLTFELTTEPAVGVAVFCSRFGWKNVLTAIWIWRRDNNRGRARACLWFCLAGGALRVVVCSFCLALLVSAISSALNNGQGQQNRKGQLPAAMMGPVFLVVTGPLVASMLVFGGCISARRYRVRVWIDDQLHHARESQSWPPKYLNILGQVRNDARGPWLLTLGVAVVASFVLALIIFGISSSWTLAVIGLLTPMSVVVLLSQGVLATRPDQCWGDVAAGAIPDSAHVTSGLRGRNSGL
jgi:hypothetical protein